MEYAELKAQIEANEQQIQQMKEALKLKEQDAKRALADDLRQQIDDAGFALVEILSLMQPAKAKKTKRDGKLAAVYVNPDNPQQTYTKGPKPGWLKERLASFGIDPADKQAMKVLKEVERHPQFGGETRDDALSEVA